MSPFPGHLLVSVRDVLDHSAGLAVHPAILASRLDGTHRPNVDSAIDLSPDGKKLTINGSVVIDFKTDIHIAIVRKLAEGFKSGSRFSARTLLDHTSSSAKTLRQAFGTKLWAKLEPYLKSENGLWGFVP